MEPVLNFLNSIAPLEEGLRDYLSSVLKTTNPPKDTILLREGSILRTIGFIEKGLIRGFKKMDNGSEKTTFFMKEGDVFVSVRSYFRQIPAKEALETLEPCIIDSITYSQYKQALKRYPSFHEHRAELLEKYYVLGDEREEMRQQHYVYDRFCYLVTHYPDLIDRVPDKFLASFIGTSSSYFSNLKSQYKDGNRSI
jgi:CRP-like cAMP-binding protein